MKVFHQIDLTAQRIQQSPVIVGDHRKIFMMVNMLIFVLMVMGLVTISTNGQGKF